MVRKPASSLYHHISSVKPTFMTRVDDVLHFAKTITFRSEIIPDKKKKTLTTSLLYSQGSDIYELECVLPLNSFYKDQPNGSGKIADENEEISIPNRKYGEAFKDIEDKKLSPNWVYSGETVSKISYLDSSDDSTIIAMSKNGSLAWFRDGIKVPIHIVQEMMGPMTSYAAIHSHVRPDDLAVSDFGLNVNLDTLVKSQSNGTEEDSILKIIDNSGKPGDILRTIKVPDTTVTHTVRFFDNYLFGTCSDDNTIRFWDTRTSEKPLFVLTQPKNGRITSFDTSQITGELFVTGTSTGVIKLWDVRAVENATTDLTYRQNGEDPIQNELVSLYHSGGDSVVDVQFSETSSSEFLTVGGTGNVYHWDMEYFFSRNDDDNEKGNAKDNSNVPAPEELQGQCLKFFHTGGSRRSMAQFGKKNTVAWHPIVDNLIGTVDVDSLVSVYKPFTLSEFDL
ncbi:hypothetical protein KAFR_0G01890 [Kazachstania africana CBS 2517]|uniref:Uncharacterized protein n=1 Tax=Kazachstania africana (strain ATCC 22294 / BCRC 22015 / CBS 2517 / CECT 1963 / NBRC 1671 / NRRL Y-8276) TaxID=1071382 RepID=H2AXX3_KAZAF|nr:hypothetical protein KAFR_0G01890 [Kazachstania africana CBS 2517]CCF59223.1 hypothetical protein KAFR_0G01890 [Kazachstania africana CBS 2517]